MPFGSFVDRFDYLIVGAGFSGAVCAERLASAGARVLIIDQRAHVGGNAYDEEDDAGILVHRYGPHVFHTNSDRVWSYLSQFTEWRPYEHRVLAAYEGQLLPVPINRRTLDAFGGDVAAAVSALYAPYTRKQWGCDIADLDPSVLARVAVRESDDDRYFLDRYQAMPLLGYTRLITRILAHDRITVVLNMSYALALDVSKPWDQVIYTGPIDEFFEYRFGRLPYRSAEWSLMTLAVRQAQPVAVVNVPSEKILHTRVTEFKHLTGQEHARTTLAFEYPTDGRGAPAWPIPTAVNQALYRQYQALADETPSVSFCGRLGTYQYLDMDACVLQALTLTDRLLGRTDAEPDEETDRDGFPASHAGRDRRQEGDAAGVER